MPAGIHTGKRLNDAKRNAIVRGLANGESKAKLTKRLRTSVHIVNIVADEQWQDVAQRKELLAAQAEHNAAVAGEQLAAHLATGKIAPNLLVPIYGVSMDKAIALRNDPQRMEINVTSTVHGSTSLIERMETLSRALNSKAHSAPPVLEAEVSPTLSYPPEGQRPVDQDSYQRTSTTVWVGSEQQGENSPKGSGLTTG